MAHLEYSIAEICKSYMPSVKPPVTCLECPHHGDNEPPHIELNIKCRKFLVCNYKMGHEVYKIHERHYVQLFEPSLTTQESGELLVQSLLVSLSG